MKGTQQMRVVLYLGFCYRYIIDFCNFIHYRPFLFINIMKIQQIRTEIILSNDEHHKHTYVAYSIDINWMEQINVTCKNYVKNLYDITAGFTRLNQRILFLVKLYIIWGWSKILLKLNCKLLINCASEFVYPVNVSEWTR